METVPTLKTTPVNRREEVSGLEIEAHDLRLNPRYEGRFPMNFHPFSSGKLPSVEATACNYSQCGLCFHSSQPLNPGQYIYVRTHTDPDGSLAAGDSNAIRKWQSLAQVRWCREEASQDLAGYVIGIEYL